MTGRTVPEWIGKTPDAAVPPRVRLRVWERAEGECQAGCNRKLRPPVDTWECDHVVALVNGGGHRESNLRVACSWCHRAKTAEDVAEKATVDRARKKHLGLSKSRNPMPGSRASGLRRRMDGTVERRSR